MARQIRNDGKAPETPEKKEEDFLDQVRTHLGNSIAKRYFEEKPQSVDDNVNRENDEIPYENNMHDKAVDEQKVISEVSHKNTPAEKVISYTLIGSLIVGAFAFAAGGFPIRRLLNGILVENNLPTPPSHAVIVIQRDSSN